MATKSLLKARPSKKVAERREPLFLDEKYMGDEPVWDHDRALTFSDEVFDHHLRAAFRYYNYFFSIKDMKKHVIAWVKHNMPLTKEQLNAYITSNPEQTTLQACAIIRAVGKGMPLKEKHKAYVTSMVMKIVSAAVPQEVRTVAKKEAVVAKVPTIQERLAEKTSDIIADIEGQLDLVLKGKATTLKIYDHLTAKSFAQAQVGKVREWFQRYADELTLALGGTDTQLAEGYSHLTKASAKKIMDFYAQLFADLDSYTAVKKATKKVRLAKPQSKDKVVAKMKYMKESKELKLVSINPVDIVGASELWCYNVRYRKLCRYVADAHAGTLGVKGTTIVGFDEAKSVAKTLRKPDEQLREFAKTGKVGLRTFLTNIKAVETKLNGRINQDMVLLKVQ